MKMSEADRRYYRKLAKKLAKHDIPGESGEHHRNIYLSAATLAAKLDFGQNSTGSSAARDTEHRIVLDDLMSALEH